jgi:microcystin-dependent protein
MHPASITNYGGSQPHENRQPYLVLNFVIALQGAFPREIKGQLR